MPASVSAARDAVALGRAADEQVVDVAGLVLRQLDELAEPELGVASGDLAPAAIPPVEVREEDAQHPRLQLVEAGVVTDEVELVLVARPVEREHLHAVGELVVVRHDEAAVADAEEVLRRIEAVRGGDAALRDARGAERLCRVLDHRDAERDELVHRRGPAEQVHRHERARARCDLRRDVLDVDVHRRRVDVGEHRRCATARDRLRRRVERERRTDRPRRRGRSPSRRGGSRSHRCRSQRRPPS